MNVITLTGNSTKDIELTYGPSGTAFAKGTIAVRRDFKNQDGEYDTDFINFTSIGKISETLANYINKGDKFGITGRLQIRTFERNGERQYFTEVVVNGFDFPSKRDNSQSNTNTGGSDWNSGNGRDNSQWSDTPGNNIDIDDDPDSDLPF